MEQLPDELPSGYLQTLVDEQAAAFPEQSIRQVREALVNRFGFPGWTELTSYVDVVASRCMTPLEQFIIEDNAFIGSRSIVVEGVSIGEEAVLGANVVLTGSTKVIDVTGKEPKEQKGTIPPRSVVIPGTYNKQFPAGEYGVPCALIIGSRKESTDKKTSLIEEANEIMGPRGRHPRSRRRAAAPVSRGGATP